jgi:hypothetical protein
VQILVSKQRKHASDRNKKLDSSYMGRRGVDADAMIKLQNAQNSKEFRLIRGMLDCV